LGVKLENGKALTGFRKNLISNAYTVMATCLLFLVGLKVKWDERDEDYGYYLGPNYKKE
jgi:hypothetical protein